VRTAGSDPTSYPLRALSYGSQGTSSRAALGMTNPSATTASQAYAGSVQHGMPPTGLPPLGHGPPPSHYFSQHQGQVRARGTQNCRWCPPEPSRGLYGLTMRYSVLPVQPYPSQGQYAAFHRQRTGYGNPPRPGQSAMHYGMGLNPGAYPVYGSPPYSGQYSMHNAHGARAPGLPRAAGAEAGSQTAYGSPHVRSALAQTRPSPPIVSRGGLSGAHRGL
jgi:hypothetical protein